MIKLKNFYMRKVSINLTVDHPGAGQPDTIINLTDSEVTPENVQVIVSTLQGTATNFPNEDPETKYQLDAKIEDLETGEKFEIKGTDVKKSAIEEVISVVSQAFNSNEETTTTTQEETTTTTIV